MNYMALIENRKSVRAFRSKEVTDADVLKIKDYCAKGCQRLVPEIKTELKVYGTDARMALEGSAGYNDFLVGAPQYLVLLSEKHEFAYENGGYMMEDMILKLSDMGFDSCWITFTDSDKVKEALGLDTDMQIAAIAAFGYGERTTKKMRINILSMSNIDIAAKRGYFEHKKDIDQLVYMDKIGQHEGLDELMGFYDDMLWQSFYAATQTPSYLNRQPYAFVVKGKHLVLTTIPDQYTDDINGKLNLGVVMLHFAAVAGQWAGASNWDLTQKVEMELPEGSKIVAVYPM